VVREACFTAEHLISENHLNALSLFSQAILLTGLTRKNGSENEESQNNLFKIKTGYLSVIRHCIHFNGLFNVTPNTNINKYFFDPIVHETLAQLAMTISSRMFNNKSSIKQIELPQEKGK
jgi:hypothetical protein